MQAIRNTLSQAVCFLFFRLRSQDARLHQNQHRKYLRKIARNYEHLTHDFEMQT